MSKDDRSLRQELLELFRADPYLKAGKCRVFEKLEDNRKPPWISVEFDVLDVENGAMTLLVTLWSARVDNSYPERNIDRFAETIARIIHVHSSGYIVAGGASLGQIKEGGKPYRTFEFNVADSRLLF